MFEAKATMEAGDTQSPATVRVWDPLVRIFHWSLVGLFTFAFLTGDEWQGPHETAGYIIAGLIAFRVIWGSRVSWRYGQNEGAALSRAQPGRRSDGARSVAGHRNNFSERLDDDDRCLLGRELGRGIA